MALDIDPDAERECLFILIFAVVAFVLVGGVLYLSSDAYYRSRLERGYQNATTKEDKDAIRSQINELGHRKLSAEVAEREAEEKLRRTLRERREQSEERQRRGR